MILKSEHELRFQGSYRFSEIKGFVTVPLKTLWYKTA